MAYTARTLTIIANAKAIFKDRSGGSFDNDTIVLYANMIIPELERRGAFKTLDTFDTTADTYEYDITSEFSDLVQPLQLGYKESSATYYRQLKLLNEMQDYLNCKDYQAYLDPDTGATEYSGPTYVYFENGTAYVWPAPTSTITDGFQLFYKNAATKIADSVNPPTPEAFDDMYTYHAVYMGFLGDRPSRTSESISQAYQLKAMDMVEKYIWSLRAKHGGQIKPDRW